MGYFSFRMMASLVFLTALSACSLPRGAALQSEILSKDAVSKNELAVYVVNKALLPKLATWSRTGKLRSDGWIAHKKGPESPIIAAGDHLRMSIWDSDENALLSAPGQKNVVMNQIEVAADGTIFVPYLDRIYVAGMTRAKARKTLQTRLAAIIASAQVQLSILPGRHNSVDLVGGVAKPGSYPLVDRNFTVLGLISAGGGIPAPLRNPQIRLLRSGKVYVTSTARLYADPRLDTTLHGGDKVIVQEDSRYFLSLGAAGSERQVYFKQDRISALDAISMIGGISDSRADPKGVLILRSYPKSALRINGHGPSKTRTVFSIDLTSADGLFSAGQFQINPHDVVLITESPVTSVRTVFGLIGRALGIARRL